MQDMHRPLATDDLKCLGHTTVLMVGIVLITIVRMFHCYIVPQNIS